ncbi:MAG: hypothetical protein IPK82_06010 [Polyangiaceae bacterium]|nr:hypothetical protein [Polyangiaceae bacterium]
MALDFAQVDAAGVVTGLTVPLDRRAHFSIIHGLAESTYPLLLRMREYYEDASYKTDDLPGLETELTRCLTKALSREDRAVVEEMLCLVRDSVDKGLEIEAIAD